MIFRPSVTKNPVPPICISTTDKTLEVAYVCMQMHSEGLADFEGLMDYLDAINEVSYDVS